MISSKPVIPPPPRDEQMLQHLLVIEDSQGKRVVTLRSATASIGRAQSNSIVLHSPHISRQHAILLRTTTPGSQNHQFRIVDGNLQGKRSTYGLMINGVPCLSHDLQHGDRIHFGEGVSARYYAAAEPSDIEYLTSCETEDLSSFLNTLQNPFQSPDGLLAGDRQANNESAITRLASIPELFIHPIIEITLKGKLTYLNPAAIDLFPDLPFLQTQHPIVESALNLHLIAQGEQRDRPLLYEIALGSRIYEQSVQSLIESELIRIYLVDITARKESERKLLESQSLSRHAFDSTSIGMALLSPEGRWLKVNDALCQILGYSEAEFLSMGFQELTHPRHIKAVLVRSRQVLLGKISTYNIEKEYIHKQGHTVWVLSSVSLVRDRLGVPKYFVTQIQDISGRKASEAALQKTTMLQTAILKSTTHAVISTSTDGTITTFNAAAERMLGYKAEEVVGQKTPLLFHNYPEVIAKLEAIFGKLDSFANLSPHQFLSVVHNTGATHQEWTYLRKDQSQFPVEIEVSTLFSSHKKATGFLITAQDITERKQTEEARRQAEQALKQAHDELELRVRERTQDLQRSNEQLKAEIIERINAQEEVNFLQKITQKISETQDLHAALNVALQHICEATGWDFGEAWIPSTSGHWLEYGAVWHREEPALSTLSQCSKTMIFASHQGIPGRVWQSQQPEWLHNIPQQAQLLTGRIDQIVQARLHNGFAIPVIENQGVVAVLVFFMEQLSGDQPRQVKLVSTVALQIGALIQRKKAEGALRSLLTTNTALIKALPDWMFRIDFNGALLTAQAPKNSTLPFTSPDFLGKTLRDVLPAEVVEQFAAAIAQAKRTQDVEMLEYPIQHGNEVYEFEARFSRGEEDEIITIIRDITERKRAEANIRRALSREKELNELKTRFVSMASHEFRTPLATILASSELLEHYRHKWSEEKNLGHIKRIQRSTQHMTDMINDVLLLSSVEAGKFQFKASEINLVKFCQELAQEMQLSSESHQLYFEADCRALFMLADQKLLRQILENLLSNAIKYSPEKERIYLSISHREQAAILSIRDEGIGIPESDASKIFNEFDRASNVGTISGTGLGLSIVKKAVDLHEGTITLKSEINQGSTFILTFPLSRPYCDDG